MSTPPAHFYCDDPTRAVLAAGGEKVLLLGSYGGFSNFGDVLQLKGAIAWHRATTRLEPVLICHTTAIPDAGFCERQRAWFGIHAILYWSPDRQDMSAAGLRELADAIAIPRLHVYGGGFLNRFWGQGTIAIIEALIARFGVGHYVMSGQQIDEQIVPELREHFRRHTPLLAGGRDPQSARFLTACGVESGDSFDDAAEPLRDLVAAGRAAPAADADLLLHLNFSYYTGAERIEQAADILTRIAKAVRAHAGTREPKVLLLHAYADKRVEEIVDTLGAVSLLEDRFPFFRFEALELGHLSLHVGRPSQPLIGLPKARLGLSSSYHVSMLMNLLGVPCYLLAANAYYEQKRAGLGGPASVEEFLAAPAARDLSARFAMRGSWSTRLAETYRRAPQNRAPEMESNALATRPMASWRPKGRMDELPSSPAGGIGDALRDGFEERGRRVVELEALSQRLWSELQRLTSNFEAEIKQLNEAREQLASAFDVRGKRVAELEQHARALWEELKTSTANFESEIAKLSSARAALADGFEERGRRVLELEAHANELWTEIQRLGRAFDPRGAGVPNAEGT